MEMVAGVPINHHERPPRHLISLVRDHQSMIEPTPVGILHFWLNCHPPSEAPAPPPSCTEQSNGRMDFPAGVRTWSGNRRRVLRINSVYPKYAPSPGSPRARQPAIWSPAVVLVESPNSENLNPPLFEEGSSKESSFAESQCYYC